MQRLDQAVVARHPELSRSMAARLIRDGRVMVDGVVVTRPSAKVLGRIEVEVPPPAPDHAVPQDLPIRIAYEDDDVVVVDKAAGMVVHPGAGHPDGTLVNALLHHVDGLSGIGGVERPGIVHRLDRGTSGLLVVAKHDVAHRHLAAQFAAHTAGRTYLAVVLRGPAEDAGTITTYLARHVKDRVRFASQLDERGKRAVTHYEVLGRGRGVALVQCKLETGRTHQIRVHLTEHGSPIVGDGMYTRRDRRPGQWLRGLITEGRPLLHAWQLAFAHPRDDRPMRVVAPVPPDMEAVLLAAGLDIPVADGRTGAG